MSTPLQELYLRTCRKCGHLKLITEFTKQKDCRFGRSHTCKKCINQKIRELRVLNPEKFANYDRTSYLNNRDNKLAKAREYYQSDPVRNKMWKRKWVSENKEINKKQTTVKWFKRLRTNEEWYAATLSAQNNGCAICGKGEPKTGRQRRLHVDHDHACCPPGRSCDKCRRGLLCISCNVQLSFLENVEWREKALKYLEVFNKSIP